MLLPPDLREWIPEGSMVHFILETEETLDIQRFSVNNGAAAVCNIIGHDAVAVDLLLCNGAVFGQDNRGLMKMWRIG